MAKTIDPYYEWLAIPPKDQPPNHYRLLGVDLFEMNRGVIDAAANRQMIYVKTYELDSESSQLSQRILNELAAARICLLNPPKKQAYDEQLRAELEKKNAGQGSGATNRPRPRSVSALPSPSSESPVVATG